MPQGSTRSHLPAPATMPPGDSDSDSTDIIRETTMTTYRHETYARPDNLSLVEATTGRRDWSPDEDSDGVVVASYTSPADADRDRGALEMAGIEASTATASTEVGAWLYVTIGVLERALTGAPSIRVSDIVIHDGEEWTVEAIRSQYHGRALVADLRWWGGAHRGRERSVCFWRAAGEIRPLAWSPDGVLEHTGRRIALRDGIRLVEVAS
jgi:hypothetical protein